MNRTQWVAMSGKPVRRTLPPLAEVAVEFHGFGLQENRSARLTEILRRVVHRVRRSRGQAFYTMRDIAHL